MEFGLYILYAFIQAILIARYIFQEESSPVFTVVMLTIFAPLATVVMLGCLVHDLIVWAVTGKRPNFRGND